MVGSPVAELKVSCHQQKSTIAVVLSEISNLNGKIRQTGGANYRQRAPLLKVEAGNAKFLDLYSLDLDDNIKNPGRVAINDRLIFREGYSPFYYFFGGMSAPQNLHLTVSLFLEAGTIWPLLQTGQVRFRLTIVIITA